MKQIFLSILVLSATLITVPLDAQAYLSHDHQATELTERSALFTISFSFGHSEHDTYIPIFTNRQQKIGSVAETIGYTFGTSSEHYTQSAGMVLSSQPIVDNTYYKVPAGYRGTFTLVVVATALPPQSLAGKQLQVTDLPFYWDDSMQHLYLKPSELQYYVTPVL